MLFKKKCKSGLFMCTNEIIFWMQYTTYGKKEKVFFSFANSLKFDVSVKTYPKTAYLLALWVALF